MKESKRFRLGFLDVLKGGIVAILSAVVSVIGHSAQVGTLTINPDELLKVSVAAGSAYLIKNVFEDKTSLNDQATPPVQK